MNNLNEIYVATKDKEYVLAKIEGLCQKYNSRNGVKSKITIADFGIELIK